MTTFYFCLPDAHQSLFIFPQFSLQNMYLTDAMLMKMLVGANANKSKVCHDEFPLGTDTGGVFKSLGVHAQSAGFVTRTGSYSDNEIKRNANVDTGTYTDSGTGSGGFSDSSDSVRLNSSIGTYELGVRPILTNFLGYLHGGALAMSIEHAARMHAHSIRSATDRQSGTSGEEWMDGSDADQGVGVGVGTGGLPPTIVRMEITYKAPMKSAVEITSSHDASAGCSDQGSLSTETPPNPFKLGARRSVGEVFNQTASGSSPSPTSDATKSGSRVPESSATYTCYWSNSI